MKLFRKRKSKFLWYDFAVRGVRFRGSTKETNQTRAEGIAALKFSAVVKEGDPLKGRPPTLREYSKTFLGWVDSGRLEDDSRRYYRNGWRLIEKLKIAGMRMDRVSKRQIEKLKFPGSPSNGNNAQRTLRRMFSMAVEDKLISKAPGFKLFKEHGRSLRLNDAAERVLMPVAEQPLKDIIVVMRDTGQRNARELYCMRVENIDFDAGTITVPDSKTPSGTRSVPLTDRVEEILRIRCAGRNKGWVWESCRKGKHISESFVNRQWVRAREAAGLPEDLVLYCARHDYGSFVLRNTGNMKVVMDMMGQRDYRTALKYQHHEMEVAREALRARHNPRHTAKNDERASA